MISPFKFIVKNDTQIATRCNLINNLIIYGQQSFIIFITRESHIAGFLSSLCTLSLLAVSQSYNWFNFILAERLTSPKVQPDYKQVGIICKQCNLFTWNSHFNVIDILETSGPRADPALALYASRGKNEAQSATSVMIYTVYS